MRNLFFIFLKLNIFYWIHLSRLLFDIILSNLNRDCTIIQDHHHPYVIIIMKNDMEWHKQLPSQHKQL